MRLVVASILAASVTLASGCSKTDTSTSVAGPVNTHCPIMGREVPEDGGSTTWNGQTVAFCCEGCLPKWNELSDDGKATKLAEAGKTIQDHSEHEGNDHAAHGHDG